MRNRVPHPARIRVGLQWPTVHEDLTVGEVVVEDRYQRGSLDDPLPAAADLGPARKTLVAGTIFEERVLPLTRKVLYPGLRVAFERYLEWRRRHPHSRQVRLAVGGARRRSAEIRLAVSGSRDSRCLQCQPL